VSFGLLLSLAWAWDDSTVFEVAADEGFDGLVGGSAPGVGGGGVVRTLGTGAPLNTTPRWFHRA
jgi:hypothetical protein